VGDFEGEEVDDMAVGAVVLPILTLEGAEVSRTIDGLDVTFANVGTGVL
jgi:hypothetical protein